MSRLALGQLVGWSLVEAVDAVLMAVLSRAPLAAQRLDRALHYAYDVGLACAAGVLSLAAVIVAERIEHVRPSLFPRARAWIRRAALFAIATTLGAFVLREDLSGPASRWRFLPLVVLIPLFASAIPLVTEIALLLRARLSARRARVILFAFGVLIVALNHGLLAQDYDGIHLFASWAAAILVGVGVSSAPATSTRAAPPERRLPALVRTWGPRAGLAILAVLGVLSLVLTPSNGVRVDLVRAHGGSISPWMARLHAPTGVQPIARAWFGGRDRMTPIPPSPVALIPKNAVVVFLTVDALRQDLVTLSTHEAELPAFAKLRRDAIVFTNARSVAPSTSPSVSSIFTGKYFSQLYWTSMSASDPAMCTHEDTASVRFPELLTDAGIQTAKFVGLPALKNEYGLASGFTEDVFVTSRGYAMANPISERILARLRRQKDGPLFLWTHMSDPHAPYDEGGTQGTDFERYVREVAFVDRELGRIREMLDARFAGRGVLIVSADHGEAFGEHQTHFHATTIYDELIRVPLFVLLPGVKPRDVETPVSLIDLAPTILDLFQLPTPGAFMGESFTPLLRGEAQTFKRPLAIEGSRGKIGMLFPDGEKLILDLGTGTRELYDVTADPRELTNLADQRPQLTAEYAGLVLGFYREHELRRPGYTTPFVK